MGYTKRNCDCCGKEYMADNRNLKRGWGLTCSKSCAAKKREMSKPSYNPERVALNNLKRQGIYSSFGLSERYPYSYDSADYDQWGDECFGCRD